MPYSTNPVISTNRINQRGPAYLNALIARVQAQATRLADTAARFMALGGGWPQGCTTPLWRECVMEDVPAPVRVTEAK